MEESSYSNFEKLNIRTGTIVSAEIFAEARNPAYKLQIDFGSEIGVLKSSAQITARYQPEDLLGRQIVAVVNFPRKQIGKFMSECLVLGAAGENGDVILLQPERRTKNGQRVL
ncbi:MAG: tRNA-binding protein [Flavobacterium sp.]|nr:tRNA-binding protein [Flavobacterium sp.]